MSISALLQYRLFLLRLLAEGVIGFVLVMGLLTAIGILASSGWGNSVLFVCFQYFLLIFDFPVHLCLWILVAFWGDSACSLIGWGTMLFFIYNTFLFVVCCEIGRFLRFRKRAAAVPET